LKGKWRAHAVLIHRGIIWLEKEGEEERGLPAQSIQGARRSLRQGNNKRAVALFLLLSLLLTKFLALPINQADQPVASTSQRATKTQASLKPE
jgi:hypothetical protein